MKKYLGQIMENGYIEIIDNIKESELKEIKQMIAKLIQGYNEKQE